MTRARPDLSKEARLRRQRLEDRAIAKLMRMIRTLGKLADSECVLTELCYVLTEDLGATDTGGVRTARPVPTHQPTTRPSQCASRGVVLCYTLGHHKIYLKWVQKLIKLIRLKRLISYKTEV